jgi:hypothetical protein
MVAKTLYLLNDNSALEYTICFQRFGKYCALNAPFNKVKINDPINEEQTEDRSQKLY